MSKFVLMGSAALALAFATAAPALAQIRTDESRHNQNGSSTFDSIDPTRTDPGSGRDYSPRRHRRHSGSNGASSGERGTFDSGPNDPPPPYTPQREGGR
jgi:hypothetical protein